ncbi:MAG: galactokinase [Tenuifilaceae bacterium]|nr:galactokinase [Tenuifilaceae bacterium]
MINKIKCSFERQFSSSPVLAKSPGRVNLIGEHTDYNQGFVLPAAVDRYIYFALKPNEVNEYRFYAHDYSQSFRTSVTQISPISMHWANYLLGVIAQFADDGRKVPGFDCVFGGDIPIGAGMSSSAAVECGLAYVLNHIFNFGYSKMELAKMAQRAEHEYAGVKCGIMDQFASLHGQEGSVVKLDCRSLGFEYFPLDMSHLSLILVNTGVKHSLASSEYNKRRHECNQGVDILRQSGLLVDSLRDVDMGMLQAHQQKFDGTTWNRCSYVVEENNRVLEACRALDRKQYAQFGRLMYQSHYGLRDKYQVSCAELDKLVEITESLDFVLGARMMGGGFGGCTINLVDNSSLEEFKRTITANYKTPQGDNPEIITCTASNGTSII